MGLNVSIDWKKIGGEIDAQVKKGVNESLKYLKEYAKKTSPIKSGVYNANHMISPANDNGRTISGALYNDTPYAVYLEYGVGGITYGYHRYGRLYMTGVGARVYTRTQDDNLKEIVNIIKRNLFVKK